MTTVAMKGKDWRDLTAVAYAARATGRLVPARTEGQNARSDE
jgi:hypothetical protein